MNILDTDDADVTDLFRISRNFSVQSVLSVSPNELIPN